MKKLIVFALVLTSLCFSSNKEALCAIDDLMERVDAYDAWIAAARTVAGDDQNARMLLDEVISIGQNAAPAYSDEGIGFLMLYNGLRMPPDKKLMIVCLMEGDEKTSSGWQKILENSDGMAAWFAPDAEIPTLFLRANVAMTDTWKGLLFLHESLHIGTKMHGGNETPDPTYNRAIDEYFAYSLEFDRLSEIGGDQYEALLSAEEARIDAADAVGPQYGVHKRSLDEIFGTSLSEDEDNVRESAVWLHAQFRYIARNVAYDKVDGAIIAFLHWCYSERLMQ